MRKKLLWAGVFTMLTALPVYAQPATAQPEDKIIEFRFVPGQDMFYIPWSGNDVELNRLYSLVDEYRSEITSGAMPVYVDGYCVSLTTAEENFKIAVIRSNRVKSELITNKGLLEEHFITKNHTLAYTASDGVSHNNMVVVTLRIPAKAEEPDTALLERQRREREAEDRARREQLERERAEREKAESERAEAERAAREQAEREAMMQPVIEPVVPAKPYCFAVRTNLLYDAFLLPTLGVEWRVNNNIGIKLDGSYSYWGGETGKVQKIWLLNPELRWYMGGAKRFYLGASGNFGEYNTYGYLLGKFYSDNTGYQGKIWNAGLTVGYQLYLSRSFTIDFNLGLGYTSLEYDSFNMIDGVRVFKDRNKSKEFWGPTQAGINLVWTIGSNKQ